MVGLTIGIVGTDVNSGTLRFTFDVPELSDGVSIVALFMGMFGVSEIIANLELRGSREVFTKGVKGLLPIGTRFVRRRQRR